MHALVLENIIIIHSVYIDVICIYERKMFVAYAYFFWYFRFSSNSQHDLRFLTSFQDSSFFIFYFIFWHIFTFIFIYFLALQHGTVSATYTPGIRSLPLNSTLKSHCYLCLFSKRL